MNPTMPAYQSRAQAGRTRPVGADVRPRLPGRDDADHRRIAFGTQPDPAFTGYQPLAVVRRLLPHRRHRGDRLADGAGAPRLLPRAWRAAPLCRRLAFPRWSFAVRPGSSAAAVSAAVSSVATPGSGRTGVRHPELRHPAARPHARLPWARGLPGIGVLLGSFLPSARSAQAIGLLLFFPSFLLGSGGPPPQSWARSLRYIAGVAPADARDQCGTRAVARHRHR